MTARVLIAMGLLSLCQLSAVAGVDTLKGTAAIQDCIVYSWEDCNAEIFGEDCRRFNGGGVINMGVGNSCASCERRVLFQMPGWDGTIPDSSEFRIYCYVAASPLWRRLFLYPLTKAFYEGDENSYNLGYYPEPDSGATWRHAWLDVGDADSLSWTTPGGDFTTAVACTTTIYGTGRYFAFRNFNRILHYWDTCGAAHGFILINENILPSNSSNKVIRSTEGDPATVPLLIFYNADTVTVSRRAVVTRHLLK